MSKLSVLDKENKRKYLFECVVWKREFDNIDIDKKRIDIIDEIISTWDNLSATNVITLCRLIKYVDIDDIKTNFYILSSLSGNDRRKRELEIFILQYGKEEGTRRYDNYKSKLNINGRYLKKFGNELGNKKITEYKQKLSIAQKNRAKRETDTQRRENSLLCKEFWMRKGYSEIIAIELADNHQQNMIENSKKIKTEHPRINMPNTLDYWLHRGYDYETAIQKQKEITIKSIISKERYKEKYGEQWNEKWNETRNKMRLTYMKTIKKQGGFVCTASKQSLKYFNPLRSWLIDNHQISSDDIYLGIEGSKEFFIAHSTLYYFRYDFTIRSKKIIIEFHGDRWHPSDILTELQWKYWESPHGLSADIQHDIDIKRKDVAESLGYKYYTIWSYKDWEKELKNVMNFIEENL